MVGLVVATHGKLADELIRTAEAVCGTLEQCRGVSVGADTSMDGAKAQLAGAIEEVQAGDGVLVLTDMFGGTPANLALTFLDADIEVVTGVNLPMLVKLSTCRSEGTKLRETAQLIAGYGQKNITLASELLAHAGPSPAALTEPRRLAPSPPVIALVRVDNRLLHGQVLEAWVPRLKAPRMVVADDEAAASPLAQAAMTLCMPPDVSVEVEPVGAVDWAALAAAPARSLVLFRDVSGLVKAVEGGLTPAMAPEVNLGNVHYVPGPPAAHPLRLPLPGRGRAGGAPRRRRVRGERPRRPHRRGGRLRRAAPAMR